MTSTRFRIDSRFNGPPDSGNGGYVCGVLAGHLGGTARVRLSLPPPLETDLDIVTTEDGVALQAGESTFARAWPEALDPESLAAPPAPSFDEAVRAAQGFRGFEEHIFPACFVCGPDRKEGDGLRIFPGRHNGNPTFAAPWIPDDSLSGEDGNIEPAFVWAALDCPGSFSFPQPGNAIVLLGEMTATLEGPLATGDSCVLVSWEISHEGRKHKTGTAVYDGSGIRRGVALATWIEVPRG